MLATLEKTEILPAPLSLADIKAMPLGQQNLTELWFLLASLVGCKSALEIGCCEGRTSAMFARAMGPGSKLRCMDIQRHHELKSNLDRIADYGVDVFFAHGDSRSREAIEWAKKEGPYDLIFIDGSHQYKDVKADFENYRGMTDMAIGFHDINHPDFGVKRLWNEILRAQPTEYVATSTVITGHYMGIGVLQKIECNWVTRDDIEEGNYQ